VRCCTRDAPRLEVMVVQQKVGESVSAEVALMGTWFRLRQEKDKRNGGGGEGYSLQKNLL